MGFRFLEKKKARDKRLREIRKRELLSPSDDLFAGATEAYAIRFSFDACGEGDRHFKAGSQVLLAVDSGRIVIWKHGMIGIICPEDAEELRGILARVPDGMCLAEIVTHSPEFATGALKLASINSTEQSNAGKVSSDTK